MAVETALLPRPQHVQTAEGRLVLAKKLRVIVSPSAPARVSEIAGVLCEELKSRAGLSAQVERVDRARADRTSNDGSIRLNLLEHASGAAAKPEGYTLRVGQNIEVEASDPRGLLWGVQTLLQMVKPDPVGAATVARGEISDAPAHAWRALMLDPVRSFLDLDFVRRTIRVMSAHKLNTLHLHLIDDHAWRFESKEFPRCNPPGEPCYTQAELKELVAFAQRYGVEIIPEFDFPGHAHAAVAAYPELDCEGKTRPMDRAIFCSGKPFTWEFIDRVVGEAAKIFPSRYIHLGGDEPFAVKRWETCPNCQARMKEKGVTTVPALYHTFIADMDVIVKRHGRQMIVWNDALTPGVAPMPPTDIVLDAWVNYPKVKTLAEAGYTLINSSNRPLYISSYGQRQGFPLKAVWEWTPTRFGLREAKVSDENLKAEPLPENARVIGGQACAWATEQRLAERRLYPRLLSVAETLWSGENRGDFANLSARLAAAYPARLRRLGVPDDDALPTETLFEGDLGAWNGKAATKFAAAGGVLQAPPASTGEVLFTKKEYRNFILEFERRAPANTGETGFVIRSSAPGASNAPEGFRVHSSAPPGMRIVAGDVSKLEGWNRFELVARDRIVSLTINGYLAWSVTDPAPRSGHIALMAEGEGFEVKNVKLRSLDLGSK